MSFGQSGAGRGGGTGAKDGEVDFALKAAGNGGGGGGGADSGGNGGAGGVGYVLVKEYA